MDKKILVTGYPRSGGNTLSHYFMTAGFAIPHERFSPQDIGVQSPLHVVKGWFRNQEKEVEWAPVLHQTRHPLKTIASMCTGKAPFMQTFMVGYSSATYLMPFMERACRFMIDFKPIIAARNPVYRFKIEDIDKVWHNVLAAAELEDRPLPTGKTIHPYNKSQEVVKPMIWADLCQHEDSIREIAQEWGYDA